MTRYTPYYCEENIWWLCQEPRCHAARREVVFISNELRACALFCQRAAPAPDLPVLWDYHVVLAVHRERGVEVWDLDSTQGAPLSASDWLALTFGPAARLPEELHPRFRVVDADAYLAAFSSDRGHMRGPDGSWQAPPPEWPCIGQGEPTLARFVDVGSPFVGEVLGLDALRERWKAAGASTRRR